MWFHNMHMNFNGTYITSHNIIVQFVQVSCNIYPLICSNHRHTSHNLKNTSVIMKRNFDSLFVLDSSEMIEIPRCNSFPKWRYFESCHLYKDRKWINIFPQAAACSFKVFVNCDCNLNKPRCFSKLHFFKILRKKLVDY